MALTPKQREFVKTVQSKRFKYLLYGGGVGGGKSIVALGFAVQACLDYPGIRVGVLRKTLTTLRRNTIPSIEKVLEENDLVGKVRLSKSEWTYIFPNGSRLLLIDADASIDPLFNKLRGLELTFAVMEEANEMVEGVFQTLKTRVGRWKNDVYAIPALILLTSNPDQNWVKHLFYDKWEDGSISAPYFFLQALPKDNPHLTADYIDSLDSLPLAEYERYCKGNWNYTIIPYQLVQYEWYKQCQVESIAGRIPKYCGIDCAGEGKDKTTFSLLDEKGILWFEEYQGMKDSEKMDRVEQLRDEYGMKDYNFIADKNGLGAGIIAAGEERGVYISHFMSQEKPESEIEHYILKNKRAEAYWILRTNMKNREIDCCVCSEFQKQLMPINYVVKDKYMLIESKDVLRQKLGCSPDYADAAVMGNWLRFHDTLATIGGALHSSKNNATFFMDSISLLGGTWEGHISTSVLNEMVY
jgi:phage terminase large subunit